MVIKPKLEITKNTISSAKKNPGGWVYHIVGSFSPNQTIPPEHILGAWEVDKNGNLTGKFHPNEKFNSFSSKYYTPPEYIYFLAKDNKNKWIYEIDDEFKNKVDVPLNKIYGAWLVDSNGDLTGNFKINPIYLHST